MSGQKGKNRKRIWQFIDETSTDILKIRLGETCVDVDADCPQKASKGKCNKDEKVKRRCRKSCGSCVTGCWDTADDCAERKVRMLRHGIPTWIHDHDHAISVLTHRSGAEFCRRNICRQSITQCLVLGSFSDRWGTFLNYCFWSMEKIAISAPAHLPATLNLDYRLKALTRCLIVLFVLLFTPELSREMLWRR